MGGGTESQVTGQEEVPATSAGSRPLAATVILVARVLVQGAREAGKDAAGTSVENANANDGDRTRNNSYM